MAYAIFTIYNEFKKLSALTGWYNYIIRERIPINADKARVSSNREIIGTNGRNYRDAIKYEIARVRSHGMPESPVKKDSIIAKNILLTYSYDPNLNIQLERWIEINLEWLDEEFNPPDHKISYINYEGKRVEIESNNVISVVLHMDELNPHLHCLVIPFKEDGTLERYDIHDKALNKAKHDRNVELMASYGEAMSEFGLEKCPVNFFSKKKSIKKLHSEMAKALNAQLPEPEQDETIEMYRDRVNEIYLKDKNKYHDKIMNLQVKIEQAKEELNELIASVNPRNIINIILKKIYKKDDISELNREDVQMLHKKYRETTDFIEGLSKYPNFEEANLACEGMFKLSAWYREKESKEKHKSLKPKSKSLSRYEDYYYER